MRLPSGQPVFFVPARKSHSHPWDLNPRAWRFSDAPLGRSVLAKLLGHGPTILAVGSQVIVLLKLPLFARVCVIVWAALAVFTCGPFQARLLIWSCDLNQFAEQSGWVGLVAGRETNPQQPDSELQNDASQTNIAGR